MKILLIFSCILSTVYANCEDENTCFCPNITSKHYRSYGGWFNTENPDDRLFMTEGPGCTRNLTCELSDDTYFVSGWEDTTIPRPNECDINSGIGISAEKAGVKKTGNFADLTELFGIICEDFKWKITKYPFGFSCHSRETSEIINFDVPKVKCEPHKTDLKQFYCDGPDHDEQFYSQLY